MLAQGLAPPITRVDKEPLRDEEVGERAVSGVMLIVAREVGRVRVTSNLGQTHFTRRLSPF